MNDVRHVDLTDFDRGFFDRAHARYAQKRPSQSFGYLVLMLAAGCWLSSEVKGNSARGRDLLFTWAKERGIPLWSRESELAFAPEHN